MKRGKRVYDPVTDTWSTGYWILMTQKDIDRLKERNKILEERCKRYREIMYLEGIDCEKITDYFNKGSLSCNDVRYFYRINELTKEEESHIIVKHQKPPLGVMPRDIWDRKRQEELADAMERYLEAGMKIPAEWIKEYNEISDRLEEVKE